MRLSTFYAHFGSRVPSLSSHDQTDDLFLQDWLSKDATDVLLDPELSHYVSGDDAKNEPTVKVLVRCVYLFVDVPSPSLACCATQLGSLTDCIRRISTPPESTTSTTSKMMIPRWRLSRLACARSSTIGVTTSRSWYVLFGNILHYANGSVTRLDRSQPRWERSPTRLAWTCCPRRTSSRSPRRSPSFGVRAQQRSRMSRCLFGSLFSYVPF